MTRWPLACLADVLTYDTAYLTDPETRSYKKLSVRLFGRGVVLDSPAEGSSLRMRRYQLARGGQVMVSEIWAKRGAVGLVPPEGEGALVTSHFYLFDIDTSRAVPGFIDALLRTNWFLAQLDEAARGSTGYAAVRPAQFLACTLPLPPLIDQQSLAAAFQRASRTLDEISSQRAEVSQGLKALSATVSVGTDQEIVQASALLTDPGLQNGRSVPMEDESLVRCLTLDALRDGRIDTSKSKPVGLIPEDAGPFQVAAGDIFIMRGSGSHDRVGLAGRMPVDWAADPSHRLIYPDLFIKVGLDARQIDPDYFVAVWNSPLVRSQLSARTTSGQWKLSQRDIRAVELPVPPLEEQSKVVRTLLSVRKRVDLALDLINANEGYSAQFLTSLVGAQLLS